MRTYSIEGMGDALLSVQRPLIVTHVRPDGDTVAACSALCYFYRDRGADVAYASEEEIPKRLQFLVNGFRRETDFTGYTPITVDVASPGQLGALAEPLKNGRGVRYMIDHHASGRPFAPGLIMPDASSAAEVIFLIFESLEAKKKMKITKEIATALYAGMSSDTGCFRYSNATPRTHKAAARLLAGQIDGAEINRLLFDAKTDEQIRAEGVISEKLISAGDGITYATLTKAERDGYGLTFADFETAIDIVRSLEGTEIAMVAKETETPGEYRISMRSTGFDVSEVAATFDGGGHVRAAGCSVTANSPEEAAARVLSVIRDKLKNKR